MRIHLSSMVKPLSAWSGMNDVRCQGARPVPEGPPAYGGQSVHTTGQNKNPWRRIGLSYALRATKFTDWMNRSFATFASAVVS